MPLAVRCIPNVELLQQTKNIVLRVSEMQKNYLKLRYHFLHTPQGTLKPSG